MDSVNRPFEPLGGELNRFTPIDYGFAGLGRVQLGPNLSLVETLEPLQRTISFDNGPSNYVRPDALVLDDLAKALAEDPLIHSWNLQIACEKGRVHIQGRVDTLAVRKRLEVLVASIYGIQDADLSEVEVSKGVEPVKKENEQEGKEE